MAENAFFSSRQWQQTPLWERLVGLAGFLLICCTVVYLTHAALQGSGNPPDIHFELVSIHLGEAGYLVLVDVSNPGGATAADLQLEAQLQGNGAAPETVSSQLDYLAPRSTRRVGFYFATDPARGELMFRPLGYREP